MVHHFSFECNKYPPISVTEKLYVCNTIKYPPISATEKLYVCNTIRMIPYVQLKRIFEFTKYPSIYATAKNEQNKYPPISATEKNIWV